MGVTEKSAYQQNIKKNNAFWLITFFPYNEIYARKMSMRNNAITCSHMWVYSISA